MRGGPVFAKNSQVLQKFYGWGIDKFDTMVVRSFIRINRGGKFEMTKIDIISGFLGAGKTTLIKKLIGEAFKDELICLIENEFGEIGIDGGFLKQAGVNITEMNS